MEDLVRLETAYMAIPKFAKVNGYDLRARFERNVDRGYWYVERRSAGDLAGFAAAYERDGTFYLWLLGVAPPSRRKGVAASLLDSFLEEGRARGYTRFTAKTHAGTPGMVRALEGAGFVRTATEPLDIGTDIQEEGYFYERAG